MSEKGYDTIFFSDVENKFDIIFVLMVAISHCAKFHIKCLQKFRDSFCFEFEKNIYHSYALVMTYNAVTLKVTFEKKKSQLLYNSTKFSSVTSTKATTLEN